MSGETSSPSICHYLPATFLVCNHRLNLQQMSVISAILFSLVFNKWQ